MKTEIVMGKKPYEMDSSDLRPGQMAVIDNIKDGGNQYIYIGMADGSRVRISTNGDNVTHQINNGRRTGVTVRPLNPGESVTITLTA